MDTDEHGFKIKKQKAETLKSKSKKLKLQKIKPDKTF
jgi:hypothetical protein